MFIKNILANIDRQLWRIWYAVFHLTESFQGEQSLLGLILTSTIKHQHLNEKKLSAPNHKRLQLILKRTP